VLALDAEVAALFPKDELGLVTHSGGEEGMLGEARRRRCRRSENFLRKCLRRMRGGGLRFIFRLFSKDPVVFFVQGSILVLSSCTTHHLLLFVLVPHGRVKEKEIFALLRRRDW
jgi:hypothetical protein